MTCVCPRRAGREERDRRNKDSGRYECDVTDEEEKYTHCAQSGLLCLFRLARLGVGPRRSVSVKGSGLGVSSRCSKTAQVTRIVLAVMRIYVVIYSTPAVGPVLEDGGWEPLGLGLEGSFLHLQM